MLDDTHQGRHIIRTRTSTMTNSIKKKTITRNRETTTCLQCRQRKLKCDKEQPCGSCLKRDEGDACTFVKNGSKKESPDISRTSKAEARLQHLEQLVEDYAAHNRPNHCWNDPIHHSDSSDSDAINGDSEVYSGATHYSAMLEGIEDLRQLLSEDEPGSADSLSKDIIDETDVLFGSTPRLPLSAILSKYLPSRLETDRRIAAYFRAQAICAACIHTPQFTRQYEDFWSNQAATSPLWISLLFSILHLSESVGWGSWNDKTKGDSPVIRSKFSLAAAHCLALGRYNRPQRFAVEALAVFAQAKLISMLDPSPALGLIFGTLIKLAYSMGYHRDPINFKQLTPFEGEMRRRTWSFVMQLDLLIMFQLGLPNTVQFGTWDTKIPSNYLDTDFDEDSAILPTPRPPGDPTRISFYSAKHSMMVIFDKILKHSLSVGELQPGFDLLTLHQELEDAYSSIPAVMQYKKVAQQLGDPAFVVVTRKCVELMYQKCAIVLHRRHVLLGRQESIRVCYNAASSMASAFLDMYPEFKPGGQFYEDRWLLGSITWTDWLLSVMTLSLVLCQLRKSWVGGFTEDEFNNILHLLNRSHEVCLEQCDESVAARRSARMLQALLSQKHTVPQNAQLEGISEVSPRSLPTNNVGEDLLFGQDGAMDWFQGYNDAYGSDAYGNVFETQEWAFLEDALNTDFNAL